MSHEKGIDNRQIAPGYLPGIQEGRLQLTVELMRDQFGHNLRTLRKRAGFSQDALAEVSGLHRTEISLLERGKRSPRVETLVTLSNALGLPSTHELFKGLHLTALRDDGGSVEGSA